MFVLLTGLVLTGLAARFVAGMVERQDRERYVNAVDNTRDAIQQRMETYINILRGASGLFAAEANVTREQFHAYLTPIRLQKSYPGIQGVGFSARLLPEEVEEFQARQRSSEFPDFHVWSTRTEPEPKREEYHTIVYLEPMDTRNRAALGYDMFSHPVRRAAMERARDTGMAAATGKVELVQEITERKQAGFLIYYPIYRNGRDPGTVQERRRQLQGFVYSPFRADDLLAGILGPVTRPLVQFTVYDGTEIRPTNIIHRSAGVAAQNHSVPRFRRFVPIQIAGHQWTLAVASSPSFGQGAQRHLVLMVVAGGLMISVLLYSVSWVQARARRAAEVLAGDLRASEEALREANRAKDEFLAMLGHELRNPLAATSNSLTLLRLRTPDRPDIREPLDRAERQIRNQERLVEDLLDVSRVTSGKIKLRRAPVDLRQVVEHSVAGQRRLGEAQGHVLTMHLPDDPVVVDGDGVRLEQVVVNLLSNAIKYTPAGGHIDVTVERSAQSPEEQEARRGPEPYLLFTDPHAAPTNTSAWTVVRVRDNGVGIAEEMLARVFETFTQLNTTVDRSRGGLGLGLPLVRRLVQLHGGCLAVRSQGTDQGTEFTVYLPALAQYVAPESAWLNSHLPPTVRNCSRVLLVEDNPDARETLIDLLETWGYQVEVAATGPDGVRVALETRPEVALIDIGLPEMDGYEVARHIRAVVERSEMRLLAVTGYGQPEDRERALEAGFDDHLTKPLRPEVLKSAINLAGDEGTK